MTATTATAARTIAVTATDVREWAAKKGIDTAAHGRLSAEVIAAYNKAHKTRQYAATMVQPGLSKVIEVPGYKIGKNGRKVRVTFRVANADLRKWAQAAGFPVGDRGRIPAEVLLAYGNRELALAEANAAL